MPANPSARKRKAGSGDSSGTTPKAPRAPLACERCRVKKLRCSGGYPCRSCDNANVECDFEVANGRTDRLGGVDLSVRVSQLEKAVLELRAQVQSLSEGGERPITHRTSTSLAEPSPLVDPSSTTDTRLSIRSSEAESSRHPMQRYDVDQRGVDQTQQQLGQLAAADSVSPALWQPQTGQSTSIDLPQRADETIPGRFLAATIPTQCGIAPFPPLMHHPSIWENRSRSPSLSDDLPSMPLGTTDYVAKAGAHDDPISTGLISEAAGLAMFELYVAVLCEGTTLASEYSF